MNEADYLTNHEADCLAFAVRYALDRHETTAPLIVVDEVVRKWARLRFWQRQQIIKDVATTYGRRKIWQRVLDLPIATP